MIDGQGGDLGSGAPDAGDGMDLDSLLGTSPDMGDPAGGLQGGLPQQGANGGADGASPYKFGGRTWPGGQKQAEAAWNKVYGGYSERQGILNALKGADPELLSALSQDPKMGPILAKLGIQQAREGFDMEGGRNERGASHEEVMNEVRVERHQNAIMREEWAFERKLGRSITEREQQAVYRVLEKAESLSYEEAYFLAHRQQIMQRQAQGAAAQQGNQLQQQPQGGRPKPPPRSMPGTPGPGKKSVRDMSEEEWKRNLKESGAIKELISRGMRE